MTKLTRRILLAVTASLFTVSMVFFAVSCKKNKPQPEAETYRLTLDYDGGSEAENPVFDVQAGTSIKTYLDENKPAPISGLEFSAWYAGDTEVSSDLVMPSEELTITAKYLTEYTLNEYVKLDSGYYSSSGDPDFTYTGKGIWKDPYDYTVREGYMVEPEQFYFPSETHVDSLGIGQSFDIFLERIGHIATFRIGSTIRNTLCESESFTENVWFTEELTFPNAEAFGPANALRLLGWTEMDGSDLVLYHVGQKISLSSNMTFYAVWEQGYSDFFGGDDALFLDEDSSTAVLVRDGVSENNKKEGTYNPDSGVVTFYRGTAGELVGKVVGKDYFFWLKDLAGKTFRNGLLKDDETPVGDSLQFTGEDRVTYHGEDGTDVQGTITIDLDTGEYIFNANDDSKHFIFNLTEMEMPVQGSEDTRLEMVYLSATDTEIRGYYARATSSGVNDTDVFFLDGIESRVNIVEEVLGEDDYYHEVVKTVMLGGFRAYTYTGNRLEYAFQGFYYLYEEGENGAPDVYAFLRGTETVFYFRIEKYSSSIGDYDLQGAIRLSDGLDNTYYNYSGSATDSTALVLDGFGGGTYLGRKGTYTIETREYTFFSSSQGRYTWTDEWVVFTYSSGGRPVKFRFMESLEGTFYETMINDPEMVNWAHDPSRNYSAFLMLGDLSQMNGAFYTYMDDAYYVLVWYDDIYSHERVYELIDAGMITTTGGVSHFESATYTEFGYYFTLNGDHEVVTKIGNGIQRFGDGISIDEDGVLTFEGKTYNYGAYGYSSEEDRFNSDPEFTLWTFYTVINDEYGTMRDQTLGYVLQKGETFTKVDKLHTIVLREYLGQSDGFYYLFFLDDHTVAIGGFIDNSGSAMGFILQGTLTEKEDGTVVFHGGDKAKYQSIESTWPGIETFYDSEKNEYTFTAKLGTFNGEEGAYIVEERAEGIVDTFQDKAKEESLTLDAFGNATYGQKGVDAINGTYENFGLRDAGTESFYFVRFVPSDTNLSALYIKLYTTAEEPYFEVVKDAPEAGVWYWVVLDGGLRYSPDSFALFFGDGTAYDLTGWDDMTYELSRESVSFNGLATGREYNITYKGENGRDVSATVLLFNLYGLNCIVIKSEQDDRFVIEGSNGYIEGDGYVNSMYSDGRTTFYGNYIRVDYHDDDPNAYVGGGYDYDYNWESGNVVIFLASAQRTPLGGTMDVQEVFIFDVVNDTRLRLRDNFSGARFLYKNGAVTQEKIYLDGQGNATIYDASGAESAKGRYSYLGGTEFVFIDENEQEAMHFSLADLLMSSDKYIAVYYDLNEHNVYVADDWSVLILHAFDPETTNSGEYIDEYGVSLSGLFLHVGNSIVKFTTDTGAIYYFKTNEATFRLITEDFIVEDGILYGYQGKTYWYQEEFKIPDEVTEIGSYVFGLEMYFAACTLNLNNVQKIDDYAFFNVSNLGFAEIKSDIVTWIGDYAFYVSGGQYLSDGVTRTYSSVMRLSFPHATHIGDYAFANHNMLRLGSIYLEDIEYIGDRAFMINRSQAKEERCTLDLTKADIAALDLHKDAFAFGPGTVDESLGYAFRIMLSAKGYSYAVEKWQGKEGYDDIFDLIDGGNQLGEALDGMAFYSFAEGEYLLFTATESDTISGFYDVTHYKKNGNGVQITEHWGAYRTVAVENDDTKLDVDLYSIGNGAQLLARFTVDKNNETDGTFIPVEDLNKTFYEVSKTITLNITEMYGSYKLSFKVTVTDLSASLTATLSEVTYGGGSVTVEVKPVSELEAGNQGTKVGVRFCFSMADDHFNYELIVDPDIGYAIRKATLKEQNSKFNVNDGEYQAVFEFNGIVPTALFSLSKRIDGSEYQMVSDGKYEMFREDMVEEGQNVTFSASFVASLDTGASIVGFKVTYTLPDGTKPESITVTETEYAVKNYRDEGSECYVSFYYSEGAPTEMLGLVSVSALVNGDTKTFNFFGDSKVELKDGVFKNGNSFSFTVVEGDEETTYEVVYENDNGKETVTVTVLS